MQKQRRNSLITVCSWKCNWAPSEPINLWCTVFSLPGSYCNINIAGTGNQYTIWEQLQEKLVSRVKHPVITQIRGHQNKTVANLWLSILWIKAVVGRYAGWCVSSVLVHAIWQVNFIEQEICPTMYKPRYVGISIFNNRKKFMLCSVEQEKAYFFFLILILTGLTVFMLWSQMFYW